MDKYDDEELNNTIGAYMMYGPGNDEGSGYIRMDDMMRLKKAKYLLNNNIYTSVCPLSFDFHTRQHDGDSKVNR